MKLETRSPATEIGYWLTLAVFLLGMAGYFFYDGTWGYYRHNLNEARKNPVLAGRPDVLASLPEQRTPTAKSVEELRQSGPATRGEVRARLGPPQVSETKSDGQDVDYYPSIYGMITVTSRDGRVDPASGLGWSKWKYSPEEISQQYWFIIPWVVLAYWPVRRLLRALTLRVSLDDEKLVHGNTVVPLSDMTGLRDYNRKGWVDLYYTTPEGERFVRLDNQKIARFDELVELISQARGFENPVRKAAATTEPEAAKNPPG
jgi:hypothetical protein